MAQVILTRAGQALGTALGGAAGRTIGATLGSLAGRHVDQQVFGPRLEGPRLAGLNVMGAREGAGLPRVYGRVRVGGHLIWAARFREHRSRNSSGGGKGGPARTDYSYSLSFAVALSEGEVASVERIWANGEPLLAQGEAVVWRFYPGSHTQMPDPLIEIVEGTGKAPAYRGTAYVVFEDLPLGRFGNRVPQLSFELIRAVDRDPDRLEHRLKAVNLIPGSGEFAYATDIIMRRISLGVEAAENLHSAEPRADALVSLDQLLALAPGLERINLVVGWFGTDLRAGICRIVPGVENREKVTRPRQWQVAGRTRGSALVISRHDGGPAYGGTPDDESVRQLIAAARERGLKVTLYPFVFMDIRAEDALPGPDGGLQPSYPWRGRIRPSAEADAGAEIAAFFGSGTDDRYRAFIRHYAALAGQTGCDQLLIGSELVGLTQARSTAGSYPAAAALQALAAEAKALAGPGCEVGYAADWTEYGAHRPASPVGEVAFPLDPLWADPNIDFVGIDFYPPLTDQRAGDPLPTRGEIEAAVTGGEAFDWYYANEADRLARLRTPIADLAHGEHWVFRAKDLAGWWQSEHFPRAAGQRAVTPTAWTPGMKPLRLIEVGIPAFNAGANAPNLFFDPKSAESRLPPFSTGARDDVVQRRALEALLRHFRPGGSSPAGMVPEDGVAVWAWDARPFPAFPGRMDVWSDGPNWQFGHWLNGRLGQSGLEAVIEDLGAAAGTPLTAEGLSGSVPGLVLAGPVCLREALAGLVMAHGLIVTVTEQGLCLRAETLEASGTGFATRQIDPARLVRTLPTEPAVSENWPDASDPPEGLRLNYLSAVGDMQPTTAIAGETGSAYRVIELHWPLVLDEAQAGQIAQDLLTQAKVERHGLTLALGPRDLAPEPGDVVRVCDKDWRVRKADLASARTLNLVRHAPRTTWRAGVQPRGIDQGTLPPVEPEVWLLDAPPRLEETEDQPGPLAVAFARPWPGEVIISAGRQVDALTERSRLTLPGIIGTLITPLAPGRVGRWDMHGVLTVRLADGEVMSATELRVRGGANAAFIETPAGWEMVQFRNAEMIGPHDWRLTSLLRGQQGSDDAACAGAAEGARIVVLDDAVVRLALARDDVGQALLWRAETAAGARRDQSLVPRGLAMRPWRPAALQHDQEADGAVRWRWHRRARRHGDGWEAGEAPLIEERELWRVEVRTAQGDVLRVAETERSDWLWSAEARTTDLAAGASAVAVAQVGVFGPGGWTVAAC